MFKRESTLGLIGSILGSVGALCVLIFRVIIAAGAAATAAAYGSGLLEEFGDEFGQQFDGFGNAIASAAAASLILSGVIAILLLIAGIILGFIGTAKLKKEDKSGGVLLIVSGGLAVITMFMGGWVAVWFIIAMAALCLTGGIMAVCKKAPVAPIPPVPPTTPAV